MNRLHPYQNRNRQADERHWARIRQARAEVQVCQREVARLKAEDQVQGHQKGLLWAG